MTRAALEIVQRAASPASARAPSQPRPSPASAAAARGWNSFGEFAHALALNAIPGRSTEPDRRLIRAPTGAGEVDPTGGGFLVPTEYAEELIVSLYEEAILAPLCDRRPTDKPAKVVLPAIDEKSRANGSRYGGTSSAWLNEGDQPSLSLPRFRRLVFDSHKLAALCVASNELVGDVQKLETHLRGAFGAEAGFRLDLAILLGTGAGMPLGIVNAPGTITVPKASGQTAGTIVGDNIAAMWSRLPAPCRRRAVWICNEDAEAQFETMITTPQSAGMYFPAGANGREHGILKGRPVLVSETCPALGTPGDIVLADLSQYVLIDGGLRTFLSLAVRWLNDEAVFKFIWRGNGAPIWTQPITPYNGSGVTRSPFVILAAR